MTKKLMHIWLGYDPRETAEFAVARDSIRRFDAHTPIYGLVLSDLMGQGHYWRPTERRLGKLWDNISDAPMSTEFAISRFLVPALMRKRSRGWHDNGWALFM